MDDPEALERSQIAAAQIRERYLNSNRRRNSVLVLVAAFAFLTLLSLNANLSSGPSTSDIQYKVAAKELIKQRLRDPASAEFSELVVRRAPGSGPVVCGLVISRNGFGGMSGPQRFIAGDEVLFGEDVPSRYMDEEWQRQC